MLWKSLISSAFKTKTNSLHPILQYHVGQRAHSSCPYWEKRGHDLLFACIRIALLPAVESLLNFYHHKKRLKLFFSQCDLLFCRSTQSHCGDLNHFAAILTEDRLLIDFTHSTPRQRPQDAAVKAHSFLLRDKLYADVQTVRRPPQHLRHWLGALKPGSFSQSLTEVASDLHHHCQCMGAPKSSSNVSPELVLHSVQEVQRHARLRVQPGFQMSAP